MKLSTSAALALAITSTAAPAANMSTMDEFGNLTCHDCLFDLITDNLNVYRDNFVMLEPNLYQFFPGRLFPVITTITPDPMLESDPWPAPPIASKPPTAVPTPGSGILMGSALFVLVAGQRRRRA